MASAEGQKAMLDIAAEYDARADRVKAAEVAKAIAPEIPQATTLEAPRATMALEVPKEEPSKDS
jgi:hypothetical protein